MKTILIFSLICFTLSVWGPVDKIKNSNTEDQCYRLGKSLSDCVDLNLKITDEDTNKVEYFDRCCYVRFQYEGEMNGVCLPFKEEA